MQIEGVGELIAWAEFWWLRYAACGHDQYFPRSRWNYADHEVTAEVLRYYVACSECAFQKRRAGFGGGGAHDTHGTAR